MDIPLSNFNIEKALQNKCKIIEYQDLSRVTNIDNFLEKNYGNIVILFRTAKDYGHWTCLIFNFSSKKKHILFFDSYGLKPTKEMEFIPKSLLINQNPEILLNLLKKSKYDVYFNNYKFQKTTPGIQTCGRWVILACLKNRLSEDEFYKYIKTQAKLNRVSNDELAVMLTKPLLGF